ncbi:MAG TPA: hypothetical protein VMM83_07780 [Longimicrobiales bacterium]|nr:hypothetical protein [Longimicrobiales bacterium]
MILGLGAAFAAWAVTNRNLDVDALEEISGRFALDRPNAGYPY